MTRIKICGMTCEQDISAANRFRPDYVGFVFAQSRRRVTPETARKLKSLLSPEIPAVGVFVNEPVPSVARLVSDRVIDLVQLHGDEDEDYIRRLRREVSCPVILAVRVRSARQVLAAEKLPCDLLLLDSFRKDRYGGSGERFDYSLIPPLKKPFFLAGGIGEQNIRDALRCRPYGVDVSSGAETDGRKDAGKIGRLVGIVRRCDTGKEGYR